MNRTGLGWPVSSPLQKLRPSKLLEVFMNTTQFVGIFYTADTPGWPEINNVFINIDL